MLANVRDRVGPGWPFPPGAMMSGSSRGQEAGSPTQPASLSSLAFPMCFHEQCTSCQGHWGAGPPSLGTLQGSSSCTGKTVAPFQVLLFAHVGSGMVLVLHLLHGDLVSVALLSGVEVTALLLYYAASLGGTSGPVCREDRLVSSRGSAWRNNGPASCWPSLTSSSGWERANTCFKHPAMPATVSRYSIWKWKQQLLKCDRKGSGGLRHLGKL